MEETTQAVIRSGDTDDQPMARNDPLAGLLPVLERLDLLLERAVELTEAALGSDNRTDRFRGLYLTKEDIERSLAEPPGGRRLFEGDVQRPPLPADVELDEDSRLVTLAGAQELTPFDVNVLLLALAPEVDLKYERIYAYLQDNVTRTRPTVELVLKLLSSSLDDKIRAMARFRPAAPLIRHGIIDLVADPSTIAAPALAHSLRVDPQVAAFLLGMTGLDRRLADVAETTHPTTYLDELAVDHETVDRLTRLLDRAIDDHSPLRIYLRGHRGHGRRRLAAAIAAEAGRPLLTVDVRRLVASGLDPHQAIRLAFRQAWMDDVVLLFAEADTLFERDDPAPFEAFRTELCNDGGITLLTGQLPWVPDPAIAVGVVTVEVQPMSVDDRQVSWRASAARHGLPLADDESAMLARRFRLTETQIEDAVSVASQQLGGHEDVDSPTETTPSAGEDNADARPQRRRADRPSRGHGSVLSGVLAATRGQTGHALARLTQRIEPHYRMDDIVLPEETRQQLRDICGRVAARHTVLDRWGWHDKLSLGRGTSALFSGPSGSGKTMAAEVVAAEVGLELYRIDLATVMDKYIGETEKKLDRIFDAAESSNSVLLFDEADALFGKRSAVRDSHDRYANVEISYLLQQIEEYEGLAILATNLPQNLDDAFLRRLSFVVRFPPPDAVGRRLIWEKTWPARTPLAADVDLDVLAHDYRLTGGNIKNIAMAASFYAAEEGTAVTMDHILRATRREFAQLGAPLPNETSGDRTAVGSQAPPSAAGFQLQS